MALPLVAREGNNRSKLGGGRKRELEQGLVHGAQRRHKRHKATEDA